MDRHLLQHVHACFSRLLSHNAVKLWSSLEDSADCNPMAGWGAGAGGAQAYMGTGQHTRHCCCLTMTRQGESFGSVPKSPLWHALNIGMTQSLIGYY
jgi:hypothetical protein